MKTKTDNNTKTNNSERARQEEETFILFDLIMNKYFANIFNNQF